LTRIFTIVSKLRSKRIFPPAYKIIADIEREVNIDKARKYLEDKRKEIEKTWESEATFSSILAAGALIAYVQQNKRLPSTEDLHEPFNNLVEALPEISKPMAKRLMEAPRRCWQRKESIKKDLKRDCTSAGRTARPIRMLNWTLYGIWPKSPG